MSAKKSDSPVFGVKMLARTAILIALLVALQYATASLGQLVTGSCVNLVLAVAALYAGLWSGAIVAILSPLFAFLLSIGPANIALVPCIALGNLVFVLVLFVLGQKLEKLPGNLLAVLAAAVCKFLALYLGVVRIVLPLLGLPAQKAAVMGNMFSWPQLVTALIGGALAMLIVPQLKKARKD